MNDNYVNELEESLRKVYFERTKYLWMGIAENKKARKYTHEIYWFNSEEDIFDNNKVELFECTSRFRTSRKEAYAYAFLELSDILKEFPGLEVIIKDLTYVEEEE